MSSVQLLRERFGGAVSNSPPVSCKVVRPRKELMSRLKPKVEDDGENEETADESNAEQKELEKKDETRIRSTDSESTSELAVVPDSYENKETGDNLDEADEDQTFSFATVASNYRLSSEAARHKIGVVRNARQRRLRPRRTRSEETSEPTISLRQISTSNEEDGNEDNLSAQETEEERKDNGNEPEKESVKEDEEEKKENSRLELKIPDTPLADEEPISAKVEEKSDLKDKEVKETEKAVSPSKSDSDSKEKDSPVKSTRSPIHTPNESAGSRIFASAKTAITDSYPTPRRPSDLGTAANKSPETSSPIRTEPSVTKKSPTSPENVTLSPANRSPVTSNASPADPFKDGYSPFRRRSSTRDLALKFENAANEEAKKSSPSTTRPSAGNYSATKKSPISDASSGENKSSKFPTSPRKFSQPISSFPASKDSPTRKVSEPNFKKPTVPQSSSVASRINQLTGTAEKKRPVVEGRPRASTTPMISERANIFREGFKPNVDPGAMQIRKLSVNAGERPRTKVMDMMKKFET